MTNVNNQQLRERLSNLLTDGVATEWQHRAYSDADIQKVTTRLSSVAPDDYSGKLKIAGFTDHPYRPRKGTEIEQACSTCMYYERHREHCIRPELDLPVRPDWACVLWRI